MHKLTIFLASTLYISFALAEQPPQQNPEFMYKNKDSAAASAETVPTQSAPTQSTPSKTSPDRSPRNLSATERFAATLTALETISGEFKQSLLDKDGQLLQATEGQFKLKRPGYFYWAVSPPYEQIVVGTPDALKVYDPDLEQMTIYSQDSLAGSPAALLSGDVNKISASYVVDKIEAVGKDVYQLSQQGREGQSFETLIFTFENKGKEKHLSKMVFKDKLGQTTQIIVENINNNQNMPASQFEFDAPAGTDIIIDG